MQYAPMHPRFGKLKTGSHYVAFHLAILDDAGQICELESGWRILWGEILPPQIKGRAGSYRALRYLTKANAAKLYAALVAADWWQQNPKLKPLAPFDEAIMQFVLTASRYDNLVARNSPIEEEGEN